MIAKTEKKTENKSHGERTVNNYAHEAEEGTGSYKTDKQNRMNDINIKNYAERFSLFNNSICPYKSTLHKCNDSKSDSTEIDI